MDFERTIQQVANETGISEYTLRYYEKIGLMMDIHRAENGHRRYAQDDIEWINFLKQLKATGMPLAQIQLFATLRKQGLGTSKQRREMLEVHREKMIQKIQSINKCLDVVEYKIERHRRNETKVESKN
ncbi:MAG: MerR family transcriptional regulator [Anaerolineaceae bacterium]|nr:MerR family transcriptional regulator [Anaerolineaceae bacterium]